MPNTKKSRAAAAQFAELGIDEADYTPAMRLAVKQKWSSLPVDQPVGKLREQIAAVVTEQPDMAALTAAFPEPAEFEAELRRLKRNYAVTAWRRRNQLQAALDARDLRFAAMRSKRKGGAGKANVDTMATAS